LKLADSDLEETAEDSSAVRSLKADIKKGIQDRFQLTNMTATNPFVIATATKGMESFPADVKQAAYENARRLIQEVADSGMSPAPDNSTASSSQPAKKIKLDSRAASLKFLSNALAPPQQVPEFDRYLTLPNDNTSTCYSTGKQTQLPFLMQLTWHGSICLFRLCRRRLKDSFQQVVVW